VNAADVLRKYQKQLDPEGIEVGVSRQALDEVLAKLAAADALADIKYCDGFQAGYQSLSGVVIDDHEYNKSIKLDPDVKRQIEQADATWVSIQETRRQAKKALAACKEGK
jgi:hypothetical protein